MQTVAIEPNNVFVTSRRSLNSSPLITPLNYHSNTKANRCNAARREEVISIFRSINTNTELRDAVFIDSVLSTAE